MPRIEPTEPTFTADPPRWAGDDEQSTESHPSYGKILVTLPQTHPPRRLFDSSTEHPTYVSLKITGATRRRDLNRDWIHPDTHTHIEIALTRAQWAEMVSSFGNGSGTSCTIERIGAQEIPTAIGGYDSRLAETAREVQAATHRGTEQVRKAQEAVQEAFDRNAGKVEMRKLLATLNNVTRNLPSNMEFAAKSLTEHADKVVTKAKIDIEAAHLTAARQAEHVISEERRNALANHQLSGRVTPVAGELL